MSIVLASPEVSHNKLNQFLERWPKEIVSQLTLENYSQVKDKDTFTYWLEYGSEDIGVISGILSSTKYGVWSRKSDNEGISSLYNANEQYKWAVKYGDNPDAVFQRIKSMILDIIDHSIAGRFQLIDAIDLNSLVKWKIAFIYSGYRLLPIYKRDVIRNLAKHFEHPDYAFAPLSILHQFILSKKGNEEDFFDFSSGYYQIANLPKEGINYYIIGSKYEDQDNDDTYDVFPEMLAKSAISTGFFGQYNLSHLVGEEHSKIDKWVKKNIPVETPKYVSSLRTLKFFLNLKKGDIIAIKSHGRFNKLTIIAYAVVKEINGSVYSYGDGNLGHLVHVDFLESGLNVKAGLTYAETIHHIIPGEREGHFEKIFGTYSLMDSAEVFDDDEGYLEHSTEADGGADDIRDKNITPFPRLTKESQLVMQVHNIIQNKFARFLKLRYPNDQIKTERSRIDIWRKNEVGFYIYEIKPYNNAFSCIREALGQLTDYAFSKASKKITYLIVVGVAIPNQKELGYIDFLVSNLGIDFTYECYSMVENKSVSYPLVVKK